MHLHELATEEHPDELLVRANLDAMPDQMPRDGVERLLHLDVVVPVHLRAAVVDRS